MADVIVTRDANGRLHSENGHPSVIDNKKGCLQFHTHGKLHSRGSGGDRVPSVVWHNGHLEFHHCGKRIKHQYDELLPALPTEPFTGTFAVFAPSYDGEVSIGSTGLFNYRASTGVSLACTAFVVQATTNGRSYVIDNDSIHESDATVVAGATMTCRFLGDGLLSSIERREAFGPHPSFTEQVAYRTLARYRRHLDGSKGVWLVSRSECFVTVRDRVVCTEDVPITTTFFRSNGRVLGKGRIWRHGVTLHRLTGPAAEGISHVNWDGSSHRVSKHDPNVYVHYGRVRYCKHEVLYDDRAREYVLIYVPEEDKYMAGCRVFSYSAALSHWGAKNPHRQPEYIKAIRAHRVRLNNAKREAAKSETVVIGEPK